MLAAFGAMTAFMTAFDATGQPAVSLPTHTSSAGLPIGVQLVAAYGREDVLFRSPRGSSRHFRGPTGRRQRS